MLMNFNILPDPNSDATPEDYQLQHDFLIQVRDKFDEVQTAINDMWSLQKQMDEYINKLGDSAPKELKDSVAALNKHMSNIIESMYETRNKSNQDMLNYGIKLNDKLAGVYNAASRGNFRPSKNQISVYNELSKEADIQLAKFEEIKKTEVKKINDMIRSLNLPIIIVEEDK